MTPPEAAVRTHIDRRLEAAGWVVQDREELNLHAGRGIAVREFPLAPGHGYADYLLYVDGRAAGVVEAKAEGTTLSGVETQARRYADGLPSTVPAHHRPLPFLYLSTGVETRFTNRLDPEPRSRGVFAFHRPETLAAWAAGAAAAAHPGAAAEPGRGPSLVMATRASAYGVGSANLRAGLRAMPPLPEAGLWPAQLRAVRNLETSLAAGRPRALIQMATGSGKTYTAVTAIYRLIRYAGARRVLFLVDRANLGRQALREFQGYTALEDGRTFAELYNVQHLTSNRTDDVARVSIATGTDIKPLEVVVFMRDVKSRVLFEQMKGRGVRVVKADDLRSVTPDADAKTRFVIVDCVGVTERESFNDAPALERKPTASLDKLMEAVAMGSVDADVASSLASRFARLDLRLTPEERERVREAAGGASLQAITAGIVRALDPDEPGADLGAALRPVAERPELRRTLVELRAQKDQVIDAVSRDELLEAGFDGAARERARALTQSFERFLEEHRDEIAALQLIHGSAAPRRLTHAQARELAQAITAPPREWTPEALWAAYESLDAARVRHAAKPRLLSNIVRLVRYAMHRDDALAPHPDVARERFVAWIAAQEAGGRGFGAEQREWLEMIRDHVAANLEITREDFEYDPFAQKGGLAAAHRAFGGELMRVMEELVEVLAA